MIEALYYQTYYAYLLGNIEKTRMFFEMLKEDFNKSKNKSALNEYQLKTLKKIRGALTDGSIQKTVWVNEAAVSQIKDDTDVDMKQTGLVKKIHFDAFCNMKKYIGSDDSFYLYNIEHPCGDYGRVDMVYMDNQAVYPVEVKRDQGRHDLLGQVSKYELYFSLKLNLKLYKMVRPVTICREYDRHTLTELKRMSVMTLKYGLSNDRVVIGAV